MNSFLEFQKLNRLDKKDVSNKNFRYLDDLIRNTSKEIVLDSDIILDDEEEFEYLDGISVDADGITIDGNGHAIDAKGKARIFSVESKNVTLKNIIFKNGFNMDGAALENGSESILNIEGCEFKNNIAEDNGGAILNRGHVNLKDTGFLNNSSQEMDGGAICNRGSGVLDIFNCEFKDNIASEAGGAIFNFGKISLKDSEFQANSSRERNGGAINNQNGGAVEAVNCEFKGNSSGENGGAILNLGDIDFMDCRFLDNSAKIGGAVENQGGIFNATNCEFKDNSSNINAGAISNFAKACFNDCSFLENISNNGGAINNLEGFIEAEGCEFRHNRSNANAGAIGNFSRMDLRDCLFYSNSSEDGNGGAVNNQGAGVLNVRGCEFHDSTAKKDGGAIFNFSQISLDKSKFYNNTAHNGGAVNSQEGNLDIIGCEFKGNASTDGGAILSFNHVSLKDTIFDGNAADEDGGAVNNQSSGVFDIIRCEFRDNSADRSGGAILNFGKISLDESKLTGNSSKEMYGGAVHNIMGSSFSCSNTDFRENTSKLAGSGIFNESEAKFNNCIFSRHSGENLIFNKNSMILNDCIFKNNNELNYIIVNESESKLELTNGEITDNNVEKAAICNKAENCSIMNVLFKNNAHFNIINDGNITLNSSKIMDDASVLNKKHIEVRKMPHGETERIIKNIDDGHVDEFEIPGEIRADFSYLNELIGNSQTIALTEDVLLENYERIFFEGGIEIDRDNLIIDGDGHVIDANNKMRIFNITGKDITLKNIIFKNGSLKSDFEEHTTGGGAVKIAKGGSVTIENCMFLDNSSQDDGGAILNNGTVRLINNKFMNNSSRFNGGAVCNNNMLYTTDDSFDANESKIAGAVYNTGQLIVTEDLLMSDNASEFKQPVYNTNIVRFEKPSLKTMMMASSAVYDTNSKNKYDWAPLGYLEDKLNDSNEITLKKDIKVRYEDISDSLICIDSEMVLDGEGHVIDLNSQDMTFKISSNVVIKNITFKNACPRQASLFEINGNVEFVNVTFLNNKMTGDTHLIDNKKDVKVTDSSFYNNSAKNRSLINNRNALEISGTVFVNNDSSSKGTIIYNSFDNLNMERFEGVSASEIAGGNLIDSKEKVLIKDSCFKCNFSKMDGGILFNDMDSILKIKNTRFIKNCSDLNGGTLFNLGEIDINGCSYEGNTSNGGGGAIYNLADTVLANCEFRDNAAKLGGGAIGNFGHIDLNNNVFSGNSAEYGGAINNQEGGTVHVSNAELADIISNNFEAIWTFSKDDIIIKRQ